MENPGNLFHAEQVYVLTLPCLLNTVVLGFRGIEKDIVIVCKLVDVAIAQPS